MANSARGEVEVSLAGKAYKVAFTLQAVSLMTEYLGVKTFKEIEERLTALDPVDMLPITKAILHGNGYEVSDEEIKQIHILDYLQNLLPALYKRGPNAGDKAKGAEATARPQRRPG